MIKRNISTIVVSPPIRLYNNNEYTQSLATRRGKDNKKNEWFEVDKKMNSSNYKSKKINYEYS